MICRVFQKNTSSGNGRSGTGGGTKRGMNMDTNMNSYQEVNSSTSVSLPPVPESSSYASATSAYTAADHDSYSYDSNAVSKEHVPCFSTASVTNFESQSIFNLPPPPLSATVFTGDTTCYSMHEDVSAFPSLRTLQENLQLPFFYSSVAAPPQPPVVGDGGVCSNGSLFNGNNWSPAATENQKPGPTELDCIWSF